MSVARLLVPALRWDADEGFEPARSAIDAALAHGVGGFILFGGTAAAVRDLTTELRSRAGHPLLIGSDLERGAGQQFRGATPLPPAAALGDLGEAQTAWRAGELTAREARALGVDWIFAPVADIDLEPRNPIVGTRAFGRDPATVGEMVAAWVRGCLDGGALPCAKHFPGHGRTVGDSHVERPQASATAEALEADLAPFREALAAGVPSIMTAHVAYPALDPSGAPATLSRPILRGLLRERLGFEGLVVTDAIVMEGFMVGAEEPEAAVRAVDAGCDLLLYPDDLPGIVTALEKAVEAGDAVEENVRRALARREAALALVPDPGDGGWGADADRRWAYETAVRTLRLVRGDPSLAAGDRVRLVEIDDDTGGPYPPYPRDALPAALRDAGVELVSDDGRTVVAVYADIRAWKGRPGLSGEARGRVAGELEADSRAIVLLFGHPRLAPEIPEARHLLAAWGGEALMQAAAAGWLVGAREGLAPTAGGLDR